MERYVLIRTLYLACKVDARKLYLSRIFLFTNAILSGKPSAAQWHGMTLSLNYLSIGFS
jgi:hypothetical protein